MKPDDIVQQILKELVEQYGPFDSSDDDLRRCRGLLRDLAPGHTLEVNLLLYTLAIRAPEQFLTGRSNLTLMAPRLMTELQSVYGISKANALWAVNTWLGALSIEFDASDTLETQIDRSSLPELKNQQRWTPEYSRGGLPSYPLHFIWILDCSASMAGDKIQQLNTAIKETLPHMRHVADENPNTEVLMRVLTFSDEARWHVATPTPLEDFTLHDVIVDDTADLSNWGGALMVVTEQLKTPPMEQRSLPPVLVLVSDGQPTDDYQSGLRALKEQHWGRKAIRLAVAIGRDADTQALTRFIDNPEIELLQANSIEALVKYISFTGFD